MSFGPFELWSVESFQVLNASQLCRQIYFLALSQLNDVNLKGGGYTETFFFGHATG